MREPPFFLAFVKVNVTAGKMQGCRARADVPRSWTTKICKQVFDAKTLLANGATFEEILADQPFLEPKDIYAHLNTEPSKQIPPFCEK